MNLDWVKEVAPLLGTALGGPLGGAAASFIADKLGIPDSTVEKVTDVLKTAQLAPDQIAQLKAAEIDFQKFVEEHKLDLERINAGDRASARQMQIAQPSDMPAVLTVLITVGFFSILGWMLYDDSIVNSEPILIMLGSLGTAWTGACAFWFGTTQGSQQKDHMLAQSKPAVGDSK